MQEVAETAAIKVCTNHVWKYSQRMLKDMIRGNVLPKHAVVCKGKGGRVKSVLKHELTAKDRDAVEAFLELW